MIGPSGPTRAPRARARWWSSRQTEGAVFILGAALLECLPVAAVLQLAAALVARDPGATALPLWALLALVLAAVLLGHWLRRQQAGTVLIVAAPLWAASAALVVRFSSGGYGGLSDWARALGTDIVNGGARMGGVVGLLLLTGYCWWRGLRLGQVPPYGERLANTLKFGVGAIVCVIILAVGVPGAARGLLLGRLGLLLPLEVFAGMTCLALAQAVVQRRAVGEGATPAARPPWLGFALTLSGLAVALAFAFTLVFSYDTLSSALASFGPLGAALNAGISWLIYGFSYAIFFVLGGVINWIFNGGRGRETPPNPPAPPATNPHACRTLACLPTLPPAAGIAIAILLAVVIVAVLAALTFAIYHSLNALRRATEDGNAWERRESLDVRALLGAQLRDLLAGLVPHAAPATPLPDGSVRRLYHDVLAAAERAGAGRQPAETPDEFSLRLAASAHGASEPDAVAQDVASLTAAYERVRYADAPDAHEDHAALRAAARRLIARLREQ
ncbi:MAG TPA: DUF4129 domain-containing protein [Ktedonobacterales bacterium]|nr:DUF4129 domain-containing protein [Ktedonobacterales bacterium]